MPPSPHLLLCGWSDGMTSAMCFNDYARNSSFLIVSAIIGEAACALRCSTQFLSVILTKVAEITTETVDKKSQWSRLSCAIGLMLLRVTRQRGNVTLILIAVEILCWLSSFLDSIADGDTNLHVYASRMMRRLIIDIPIRSLPLFHPLL